MKCPICKKRILETSNEGATFVVPPHIIHYCPNCHWIESRRGTLEEQWKEWNPSKRGD